MTNYLDKKLDKRRKSGLLSFRVWPVQEEAMMVLDYITTASVIINSNLVVFSFITAQ